MSFFDDAIAPLKLAEIRTKFLGYAQTAGLIITNWRLHGVGRQIFESTVSGAFGFLQIVPKIVRGFASLDTSFDPGDVDPNDATNVTLPAGDGFLSQFGEGTFGTVREDATFATGLGTFTNNGPGSRDISPGGLIFTWTGGSPPSPAPTYTNAADDTIYSGGFVTVPAGSSVVVPVVAQQKGALSSAPTSTLSLTTTLVGCTFTNDLGPIVGNDRETADSYKAKCRQAPARVSLGGPAAAYEYFSTKNLDGSVLLNDATVPVPVGITRVQVTQSSSTGIVNAYYASGSGAAIPDDVSAANRNIELQAMAVPDAITFTGVAATPLSILVAGTARIKARLGVTMLAVQTAMADGSIAFGEVLPIGGVDQDGSGNGVVYPKDIEDAAGSAARAAGFDVYAVTIALPASTVAVPAGNVPVISCAPINWAVTIVP